MFKNTIHVPINKKEGLKSPSKQAAAAPETSFDEEKFKQILQDEALIYQLRRYFLTLSTFSEKTLVDFSIPQSVSEYAQGIFVEQRK